MMDREEILKIAGEIDISEETANGYPHDETIIKFANAIAAHERDICADIAAKQRDGEDITDAWKFCSYFIEQRIRARGNT